MLLPVVRLAKRGRFANHGQGDAMHVQPYLCFEGRCEEAVAFYTQTLGAEVTMLIRFQDSPESRDPAWSLPGSAHKVRHTSFRSGVDDGAGLRRAMRRTAELPGLSLSFTVLDAATIERLARGVGRWRADADAVDYDLLCPALWRVLDGDRRIVSASGASADRSEARRGAVIATAVAPRRIGDGEDHCNQRSNR
jgi:PhnB protein